ncbi:MAG: hypothetical protein MZU91_05465 [Desulfosudis oleivorans]|nr:hypothetical protein [Desulfosudis oleivorans]
MAVEQTEAALQGTSTSALKSGRPFNGLTLYSWIDAQGCDQGGKARWEDIAVREQEQQALHAGWAERQDIARATAIKADRIFSKRGLILLRLRLKMRRLTDLRCTARRRRHSGDVVEIARENINASDTYRLPFAKARMDAFLRLKLTFCRATGIENKDTGAISSPAARLTRRKPFAYCASGYMRTLKKTYPQYTQCP